MQRAVVASVVAVVGIAVVAGAERADACSMARTYIAPTNYELVAETPDAVVAYAASATADEIEMQVVTVLRGTTYAVGDKVKVSGSTKKYYGAAADKLDFSKARPGTYAGSCTAYDYKVGHYFLLLLTKWNGRPVVAGHAFTRVNEEVDAKNDPWTTAVKEYARIAGLATPEARAKAFAALIAKGKKKKASKLDKAIAADVAAHLATPTPYKKFAELEPLYKAATGAAKGEALIAIGSGADPAAKDFMLGVTKDLVADAAPVDREIELEALSEYYDTIVDRDALAALAGYYVKLGSAYKDERWSLMWLLIHHADDTHQKLMEQALDGADPEEAGRLCEWFVAHPSKYATAEIKRRTEGKYAEHDELTRALAGLGDADVVTWAKGKLAGKKDDSTWLAVYVIAASPTKDADAIADKLIKAGGENLVTLIQGYNKARHANVAARLAQIQAKKDLSDDARKWLQQTIDERKTQP
jgi:hypothetical protein